MNEILSYDQMCRIEGMRLQKGMVFRNEPEPSLMLMSLRQSAPYPDTWQEDGLAIVYQGHDAPGDFSNRRSDQPFVRKSGVLTENGKFYRAAMARQRGFAPPHKIRVYQKLLPGIWSQNGLFFLQDAWEEIQQGRRVYRFCLVPDPAEESVHEPTACTRTIPSHVRALVYHRDRGCCAICGSTQNLHFDHILPYSKGGSSTTEKNIQLLCARHNLQKRDRIS